MAALDLRLLTICLNKLEHWPRLSSLLLGAMGILAFGPFHFYPAAILSFSVFLILLGRETFSKKLFLYTFLFCYGHFLAGTYWVGNSVLVYNLWYVVPAIWLILPSFLAIFQTIGIWGAFKFTSNPLSRVLLVAASWSLMGYILGTYVLGGFPWSLNGYTWGLNILQVTSLMGIYGLSFLTTLLFCSLASRSPLFIFACATAFIGLFVFGDIRLQNHTTQLTGINIRLIQASISQNFKWDADRFYENFNRHMTLSNLRGERPLNLVIWPEASVPCFIADQPGVQKALTHGIPDKGYIIIGGPRRDTHDLHKIYTSTFILNQEGNIVQTYDKSHLVPFGEYMPFRGIIPLSKLTPGDQDYSSGDGLKTLSLPGIPSFSPLICFEAIFPGHVTGTSRPEWLLNQTNDAWFGHSTGPYQHLQNVRVRAIEEGLPLVRSANNGISAVIDPYGRIMSRLDLDEIGFIDADLPRPLEPTFYSKHGETIFFIFLLLSFMGAMIIQMTVISTRKKVQLPSLSNHSAP